MKFCSKSAAKFVAPLLFTASVFGCAKKPEPEKNCLEQNGAMVVCPLEIMLLQKDINCRETNGAFRTFSGKPFVPNPNQSLAGVKTTVNKVEYTNDMFELKFEIPAGTIGWMKALNCESK